MKLRTLLATAALSAVAFSMPARAQDEAPKDQTKGAYVTIGAGGSWASNPSFNYSNTSNGVTENTNGSIDLGGGVAVEGGLGYDFGNNVRAELTYTYNSFSIGTTTTDSGRITAPGFADIQYNATADTSGTASKNSVLASAYYDIPTKSKFTPYVGAGLGWVGISVPDQNYTLTGTVEGFGPASVGGLSLPGGSASAFGYQAKVGVSYAAAKSTDLFVEGTYAGNTSVTIGDISLGALNNFGARAGVRFRFGS